MEPQYAYVNIDAQAKLQPALLLNTSGDYHKQPFQVLASIPNYLKMTQYKIDSLNAWVMKSIKNVLEHVPAHLGSLYTVETHSKAIKNCKSSATSTHFQIFPLPSSIILQVNALDEW